MVTELEHRAQNKQNLTRSPMINNNGLEVNREEEKVSTFNIFFKMYLFI